MKQIVFLISAIAMVLAGPDPNCMPFNAPKDATFADCCQLKVEQIPADIITKCEASVPKPSGPPPPPPSDGKGPRPPPIAALCMAECALKETKIFVDGNIDKNAAITFLSAKDPSVKSTVETAVNYCADKIKNMPGPPNNSTGPAPPCSFIPMFATGCIYGQIYKTCGDKLNAQPDTCKSLLDFANKCDWVPPMKCKMSDV
ncbi:hypothetical protein PVAND_007687 [Polypedilum vanderplanki]|uniref:Odorant-binding protein n=1 Tax=Polypedilum vanderplanki TaxID=319348 RepID=A0A9J6C7Q4_POLVA|nr:hypothetical protein PVAND_007687 [Polypedilum vanderplanki]